jgi:ketosteroid isomerase-like protein
MEEAMNIDRRQLALPALALGLLSAVPVLSPAFAASPDEEAVAKNVEAFRKAQIAANAEALAALCAPELSYSHSDGHVEDKATFIANATNGKSKILSLEYQDPKIAVVGPAAIVRFHWVGEAESVPDGKKTSTNLHILMNWQKQGSEWKLLSRASTLGFPRVAEYLAFEAIEAVRGCEEAIAFRVAYDDARWLRADFDDVTVRHFHPVSVLQSGRITESVREGSSTK